MRMRAIGAWGALLTRDATGSMNFVLTDSEKAPDSV